MNEGMSDTGNNAKIQMAVKNWVGPLCGTLLTALIHSPGHITAALDNILSGFSISRRHWDLDGSNFSGAQSQRSHPLHSVF